MSKDSDKVLPFITTVVNDIYEKVGNLTVSFENLNEMIGNITKNFDDNMNKLSKDVEDVLEETRMNRDLTLEAFSDSMNAFLAKIKEIQEESEKTYEGSEMGTILSRLDTISNKIYDKYWDIQMSCTVSNLHSLVDVLKGNPNIVRIQVPVAQQVQPITPRVQAAAPLSAPVPSIKPAPTQPEAEPAKKDVFAKSPKYKGGRKLKTHEDRMKEAKKKKRLFGKY
ncbi:MAG: hypothetical protein HWN67_20505 [Candidatus Helarchaeota archaeon]|nr:hypothetical protein [Candidatus Helarchaeota archaeon]